MDGGSNGGTVCQRRPHNRVILGVWFTILFSTSMIFFWFFLSIQHNLFKFTNFNHLWEFWYWIYSPVSKLKKSFIFVRKSWMVAKTATKNRLYSTKIRFTAKKAVFVWLKVIFCCLFSSHPIFCAIKAVFILNLRVMKWKKFSTSSNRIDLSSVYITSRPEEKIRFYHFIYILYSNIYTNATNILYNYLIIVFYHILE